MGLNKYHLGDLLERNTEYNEHLEYGIASVRGVLNSKEISDTKVDVTSRDLSKFLVVRPDGFIFNHRVHDKLGLGFNSTQETFIFTNDYVSFYVKKTCCRTILLPEYLFIWFLRPEFDRYMLFKTYGSATLFFNWDNMCELEIVLPDISIQQKYVAIYQSMVANQQSYERGLEDLKLVCDGYIEDLRRKMPLVKIGPYIKEIDERNKNNQITLLQGFCMSGEFIEPRRTSIDTSSLKILRRGNLLYNRAVECVSDRFIVAQREQGTCAVSNSYIIFTSKGESQLNNKYLLLWLRRKEFARYSKFKSHGTAHENFEYCDLEEVSIPIPDINIQNAIVEIYAALSTRKSINNELKERIKCICPILIKGSVEEGGGKTK